MIRFTDRKTRFRVSPSCPRTTPSLLFKKQIHAIFFAAFPHVIAALPYTFLAADSPPLRALPKPNKAIVSREQTPPPRQEKTQPRCASVLLKWEFKINFRIRVEFHYFEWFTKFHSNIFTLIFYVNRNLHTRDCLENVFPCVGKDEYLYLSKVFFIHFNNVTWHQC